MTASVQPKTTKAGNTYLYIVLSYKSPDTGKWKTREVSTHLPAKNNRRRAEALKPQYIQKYAYLEEPASAQETSDVTEDILFIAYLQKWLDTVKGSVELSTYEGYVCRVNRIVEYFKGKDYRLTEITPRIMKDFFAWCLKSGKRNQKTGKNEPLSVRSVRSYKSVLNSVFVQAIVVDQIITANPLADVKVANKSNRAYQKSIDFLSREEMSDLIHFLSNEPLFERLVGIAVVAAYYGLRRSEVLGLKWDAVDFDKGTIKIKERVVRVKTVQRKPGTKTPEGYRALPLLPVVRKCLEDIRQKQQNYRNFFGDTYIDSDYVFTWEDGHLYDPNYITRTFNKATAKYGRPQVTLHKLRYSCASLLFDLGWSLKKVQTWIGHSDADTTLNIYAQYQKKRLLEDVEDISNIASDIEDLF